MPELPQSLLLVLLVAAIGVAAGLALALGAARRRAAELERELPETEALRRQLELRGSQGEALRWVTDDFLRFLRGIHGPIRVRQIPERLIEFIGSTFDPEACVVLIRRKQALSDPDRENQMVVACSTDRRVRPGAVIEFGEGDLGYVAQSHRAMDRRELDQTPSATGATGAMAGFDVEIAAPLAVGGKTLGVVGITAPRRSRSRAKQLLDLVAHTTALALENSLVLHKIRTAASADSLTGVYNKGALLHRLDELLAQARKEGGEVAVFLFDLDNFKSYNDNNGHVAGDEALRLLTSLISDEVRADDVFGRFGGEEFLLILPGRSADEAEMTADKLLRLVRGHDFPGAKTQPLGKITISGGIAVFPDHADNSSALLQAADRALYRAKERGRDRALLARHPSDDEPTAPDEVAEADAADDLQAIGGIGPVFEKALNEVGISTYRQICELNWTRMVLVASRLNTFPERIVSDRWLQQARELHRRKYGERI